MNLKCIVFHINFSIKQLSHLRELENELHGIVEKGRTLQSREELQFDQQDDMDERIYEMKRLLQQAEVRAERYEILIAELETIFEKLDGETFFYIQILSSNFPLI